MPPESSPRGARSQLAAIVADGAPGSHRFPASIGLPQAENSRSAAVLMLFGVLDALPSDHEAHSAAVSRDLDVLLLARADTLRSHPGQVAFPGGRVDPGDTSPIAAALREAQEETGLDPAGVEVLGTLEDIPLAYSQHLVTPVLAWWEHPSPVRVVDLAESADVFRAPVADLLNPAHRGVTVIRRDGQEWRGPGFVVRRDPGEQLVWGFTAMLLDGLFDRLGWTEPWDAARELPLAASALTEYVCARVVVVGMTRIGTSSLDILPLSLGGNVFGWTADRDETFAILDAFVAGGGDFIDTADGYSSWVPGNSGGDSERLIGEWLSSRRPAGVVVATKVSQHPDFTGLSAKNVRAAAEASLQRLGVDALDLYYAHFDDTSVPLEETVGAFGQLVTDGLVRYTAISNYSAERVREWVGIAQSAGSALPVAIQPHYNLVHRNAVEAQIVPVAEEFGLSLVPYYALASGFLTGKYRSTDADGDGSPRAGGAAKYATAHGLAVVDALEGIGKAHGASIAATALAWLRAQPTVAAPIASASRVSQVVDLLHGARLELTADEIGQLDRVSEWSPANV